MLLSNLIDRVTIKEVINISSDTIIDSITFDSRGAVSGSLFVAIRGVVSDGHSYISNAIDLGCCVVICEELPADLADNVCYIVVEDSSVALAEAASSFYGNPSSEIKLVGVTGTNGKTTVATLLYNLFTTLGYKVGLISTVKYMIGDREIVSTHTTPDVLRLNAMFREMVDSGCSYCFMEVSSHSLVQKRVYGLDFDGAIFTNLTHDHLDYHGTFIEYIKAKQLLFNMLKRDAFALYNCDDTNGHVMVQNSKAKHYSYGLRSFADYKCTVMEQLFEGTLLDINGVEMWSRLIGKFNAYNITAVYGAAKLLGVEQNELLLSLSQLTTVEGRFDYTILKNGVVAIVDYAHTPDALKNILLTISDIKQPQQRVITVIGCGGDRDKSKRPDMALIAVKGSDMVIFTSDNPRSEEPEAILKDMECGVKGNSDFLSKYVMITDRAQAIKMALMSAKQGDILLVAGKGHETYQEIKGVRNHFSDMEEIMKVGGLL